MLNIVSINNYSVELENVMIQSSDVTYHIASCSGGTIT